MWMLCNSSGRLFVTQPVVSLRQELRTHTDQSSGRIETTHTLNTRDSKAAAFWVTSRTYLLLGDRGNTLIGSLICLATSGTQTRTLPVVSRAHTHHSNLIILLRKYWYRRWRRKNNRKRGGGNRGRRREEREEEKKETKRGERREGGKEGRMWGKNEEEKRKIRVYGCVTWL